MAFTAAAGLLLANALSPFFVELTPEVRTTYVSLGKVFEDRPMQTIAGRAGVATDEWGRFYVSNWNVSSLTDRRRDDHRGEFYHHEWGGCWGYDVELAEKWKVVNDATWTWTIYRGWKDPAKDKSYQWVQFIQSLENPYVVPYWHVRKCFINSDYLYFRLGLRRRCSLWEGLYLTPSVFFEGGNAHNYNRVIGRLPDYGNWGCGFSSVTFRLELGYTLTDWLSWFVFVEQYEITGDKARSVNADSSFTCAHNDWTLGGVGLRLKF